jgi:hypothetical protein
MTYNPEPEIGRYLERLSKATRDLPKARRRELVAEIEQHIRDALVETPVDNQAEMLTLLDRIGEPDEIVAAASGTPKATRATTMETWAIILLLIGGFLWAVGWIAGVVLLWSSSLWTTRDKLIGTLIVPGGLAAGVFGYFFMGHIAGDEIVGNVLTGIVGALLLLGPIWTSIYLGRRLNTEKQAFAAAT